MPDKYHIGQKVRIVGAVKRSDLNGLVATIISHQEMFIEAGTGQEYYGYKLDAKCPINNLQLGAPERYLEPVYDGSEKSSWSECVWKPNSLVMG